MRTFETDLYVNTGHSGCLRALWALFLSPGFLTVTLYRIASSLHRKGALGRRLGTLIWRANVLCSSCYISNTAKIGKGLRLPHPVGIVIGDGATIGDEVTIYQNVTIGLDRALDDRYPRIGDRAVLYAGSAILGPIVVGSNATVGANSVVLNDVPDGAIAVGSPARLRLPQHQGSP